MQADMELRVLHLDPQAARRDSKRPWTQLEHLKPQSPHPVTSLPTSPHLRILPKEFHQPGTKYSSIWAFLLSPTALCSSGHIAQGFFSLKTPSSSPTTSVYMAYKLHHGFRRFLCLVIAFLSISYVLRSLHAKILSKVFYVLL